MTRIVDEERIQEAVALREVVGIPGEGRDASEEEIFGASEGTAVMVGSQEVGVVGAENHFQGSQAEVADDS
jgi:hypothetical protein